MRMWFTSRLKKSCLPKKPKAKLRLVLENLEDRCLPSGAFLTVNTLVDENAHGDATLSLREAVAIAQGGSQAGLSSAELNQISGNPAGGNDTIVFSTGLNGTISLNLGELNGASALSQNMSIVGPGGSQLAISGVGTQILNNGTAGISLTLSGLTIKNGFNNGPGGAILNNGTLTLSNDVFTNNISSTGGGGAVGNVAAGATLNAIETTFANNSATGAGGGGAIFSPGAGNTLILNNCSFANNSAAGTGGGGAIFSPGASPLTLANCDFTSNSATNGGAVAATGSASQSISITNSSFSNNTALGGSVGGGALDITGNTSTVIISNSTFNQNQTDSTGGAISSGFNTGASGSGLTINRCTLTGNIAQILRRRGGGRGHL